MRTLHPPEVPELPANSVYHWEILEDEGEFAALRCGASPHRILEADSIEKLVEKIKKDKGKPTALHSSLLDLDDGLNRVKDDMAILVQLDPVALSDYQDTLVNLFFKAIDRAESDLGRLEEQLKDIRMSLPDEGMEALKTDPNASGGAAFSKQ